MHALVIEDEPLLAWDLKDYLLDLGYRSVDMAASEIQALEAARRHWPDLITADYNLTAGNGVAAVQAICAERSTPVIFVTSDPLKVLDIVANAVVIGKPWSVEHLLAGIRRAREM